MSRRPPRSTRTDTPFPYTTLCLSERRRCSAAVLLRVLLPGLRRAGPLAARRDHAQEGVAPRKSARPRFCRPFASKRSEEHTSELQSLMRISYAVFCLNKKKQRHIQKLIT